MFRRANLNGELELALDESIEHLSHDVGVLRNGLRAQVNEECRLAGEQVRIGRASIYRLDYSLNGKAYRAWFSGEDGPVYAPINPLTDSMGQLVEGAVTAWSQGRQNEGEWMLRKALGMAKASPECARVLGPLESRIPKELLRRASSFSVRFWFKHLSPVGKALVAVPTGCLSLFVFGFCFLCVLGIIIEPKNKQKAATELAANTEKQESGKLAAFRKVVKKYKETPGDLATEDEREKFNKELGEIQREFSQIKFDPKANQQDAKTIIKLYQEEIEGKYNGRMPMLLENEIGGMIDKLTF